MSLIEMLPPLTLVDGAHWVNPEYSTDQRTDLVKDTGDIVRKVRDLRGLLKRTT